MTPERLSDLRGWNTAQLIGEITALEEHCQARDDEASQWQHQAKQLEEQLRQAEDMLVKGSEVDEDRSRQVTIMADLQEQMSMKCEAQKKRIAEFEAELNASEAAVRLWQHNHHLSVVNANHERKAKDEQIRSLEAELLELNDAYKRTRLASAEKHEQIRRLEAEKDKRIRKPCFADRTGVQCTREVFYLCFHCQQWFCDEHGLTHFGPNPEDGEKRPTACLLEQIRLLREALIAVREDQESRQAWKAAEEALAQIEESKQ